MDISMSSMRKILAFAGFTLLFSLLASAADAQTRYVATLTGAQQVPAVNSPGIGLGVVVLNAAGNQITVNLTFSGLTSAAAAGHIHGNAAVGANAGVLFDFASAVPAATSGTMAEQTFAVTPAQASALASGQNYFNIHTGNFGGGEIRGQILPAPATAPTQKFVATLSGAEQVPSVSSSATGTGTVVLNAAETQITVNMSFSGLTSNATGAHIHGAGVPGTNAGVLFDFSGVTPTATSGTIPQQTFAISPSQVADLKAGLYYFNIHTANFGGGEIRGQVLLAPSRKFVTSLTGGAQHPPVVTPGSGSGSVVLNSSEDQFTVNASFMNLTSNTGAAHIHGPASAAADAGVLFNFDGVQIATTGIVADQTFALTPSQAADLKAGLYYINVHTATNGGGEVRGQLATAAPVLTVTRGGSGSGSAPVTSSVPGISCGGDCSEPFDSGTSVTLTAGAASTGSFFAGWTGGGCSGRGTCVVTLTADTTVTAVYTSSASAISFSDDPIGLGTTTIKATHILELRSAINTLRASNGLSAFVFTDASLAAGAAIKAVHIAELRTALNAVYTQRGRTVPTYSDPTITAGTTTIRGLHVAELRLAVRLIE